MSDTSERWVAKGYEINMANSYERVALLDGVKLGKKLRSRARLIAAAPKMLKELQDILDWALVEKAPLRDIEIASIRGLIAEATVAG